MQNQHQQLLLTFGFMLRLHLVMEEQNKLKLSTFTDSWQRFVFTFEPNGASQTDSIRNTTDYGLQVFWSLAVGPDVLRSQTATSPLVGVSGQSELICTVSNQIFLTGVQCTANNISRITFDAPQHCR